MDELLNSFPSLLLYAAIVLALVLLPLIDDDRVDEESIGTRGAEG